MKSLEIRSKSKEEAINKALVELNSKLEDLEIEVLESPTKGFLGFLGAKEGLYRFTVIEKETDIAKSFVKNILKNSNIDALICLQRQQKFWVLSACERQKRQSWECCLRFSVTLFLSSPPPLFVLWCVLC